MKITLCGSMSTRSAIDEMFAAGKKLEALGHEVLYPSDAETSGYENLTPEQIAQRKNHYIWLHLNKVMEGEAILVTNGEKKGIQGYIGANTFMEMSVAMFLKKHIYLLNPVNNQLGSYQEVLGMQPIVLNGKLENLK